jgi:hypothetical protein
MPRIIIATNGGEVIETIPTDKYTDAEEIADEINDALARANEREGGR